MEFIPTAVLAALVLKVTDFLKLFRNKDWSGVWTQLVAWSAGFAGLAIVAQTDFASAVPIGSMNLAEVNGWTLLVAGMGLGSTASVTYDLKRAVDNQDSAKMPQLLPPR